MTIPPTAPARDSAFPIDDTVGAWVPHGRFVIDGAPSGELAGLRFAVKDLYHVAGHPTGAGNPAWLATHPVPELSSPLVDTLLAAGATMVGKVLTDELAHSIHGDNFHYGTPTNTRAPDRVPGGSSSGSVAAVAAGLCDFALGSDTGGSTRVPASYCGVWGLRTTHGLLSTDAMVPLSPGFDTATWFAADPEVFKRVAKVLLPPGAAHRFEQVVLFEDAVNQADPVFRAPVEKVFAALERRLQPSRTTVAESGTTEELESWRQTYFTIGGYQAWQAHGDWITQHRPEFGPAIGGRWTTVSRIGAAAADAAGERRSSVQARVRGLLGDSGIAVLPSCASVAPLRSAGSDEVEQVRMRTIRITCIAGLAGLPQVSIPFATPEGLPIGVSLLGPAGSDLALIELAVDIWNELQP
ncbi:MAG: amidase [Herbaspirillum sp.]|nr:amidase [Herbaspirillum sp.]